MPKLFAVLALLATSLYPVFAQIVAEKERASARQMYFLAWKNVKHSPDPPSPARRAKPRRAARLPLGLRYTVIKRAGQDAVEISPSAVFRSGDRIQLGIEANDEAYLYIVHQGSSGTWQVMFPSAAVAGGNNRLEKGKKYLMPPGGVFSFRGQPGIEKLFLVLSRQPEPDLDHLIYTLQKGGQPTTEPSGPPTLMASARPIDNALVDRFRRSYSRDLVIDRIEDEPAGVRTENAVYVADPSSRPDSRVVTDIVLIHR